MNSRGYIHAWIFLVLTLLLLLFGAGLFWVVLVQEQRKAEVRHPAYDSLPVANRGEVVEGSKARVLIGIDDQGKLFLDDRPALEDVVLAAVAPGAEVHLRAHRATPWALLHPLLQTLAKRGVPAIHLHVRRKQAGPEAAFLIGLVKPGKGPIVKAHIVAAGSYVLDGIATTDVDKLSTWVRRLQGAHCEAPIHVALSLAPDAEVGDLAAVLDRLRSAVFFR